MKSVTLTCYFSSLHLFLLLTMTANVSVGLNVSMEKNIRCIDMERQALLSFKQEVVDRYDVLSSWKTQATDDCCNWRGVRCSDDTSHHIIMLDLHGSDDKPLMGEVGSSLAQLSHLNYLDLSDNQFDKISLEDIGSLINLNYLNLSHNKLASHVINSPKLLENLCNLKVLDLSGNYNEGGLLASDFINLYPQCVGNSLQALYLGSNKLFGSLPNLTLFPSLKVLDLSNNMLNGGIPQSLGQLSNLEFIDLHQNLLEGEVSEVHFSKLVNLKALKLDENSLTLSFNSHWVPPFNLKTITLRNCTLGPSFPTWLRTQNNFSVLDISLTGISDTTPDWFWSNLSPDLTFLDLSQNYMKGKIPNLALKFKQMPVIILGLNEFEGEVPAFLFGAQNLDVSNNKFSGISGLCEVKNSPLYLLDTCNSQLCGQLPNCWDHVPNLMSLSLSYNNLSGQLPSSLGNLSRLKFLNLRENHFSGEIPSWFNFTDLIVFDAVRNSLSGAIPSWIGSRLPNLVRLSLKSNKFHGNLPLSICNLTRIEVLDISYNSISGSIPSCLNNLNVLTTKSNASIFPEHLRDLIMMWKGQERFFHGRNLQFQRTLDLSSNRLTGEIPKEITKLVGLISLNLSRNELTGQIPKEMGQLESLDSLDLSRNHLCGPIPSSFSQIWRLSMLVLSYNNLSGKIPIGTQLQGFPISSYEGNPYLCGDPLKECIQDHHQQQQSINNEEEEQDKFMTPHLLISIILGFIIGFWGLFASLLFSNRWRHTYLKFLTKIVQKII